MFLRLFDLKNLRFFFFVVVVVKKRKRLFLRCDRAREARLEDLLAEERARNRRLVERVEEAMGGGGGGGGRGKGGDVSSSANER